MVPAALDEAGSIKHEALVIPGPLFFHLCDASCASLHSTPQNDVPGSIGSVQPGPLQVLRLGGVGYLKAAMAVRSRSASSVAKSSGSAYGVTVALRTW